MKENKNSQFKCTSWFYSKAPAKSGTYFTKILTKVDSISSFSFFAIYWLSIPYSPKKEFFKTSCSWSTFISSYHALLAVSEMWRLSSIEATRQCKR